MREDIQTCSNHSKLHHNCEYRQLLILVPPSKPPLKPHYHDHNHGNLQSHLETTLKPHSAVTPHQNNAKFTVNSFWDHFKTTLPTTSPRPWPRAPYVHISTTPERLITILINLETYQIHEGGYSNMFKPFQTTRQPRVSSTIDFSATFKTTFKTTLPRP